MDYKPCPRRQKQSVLDRDGNKSTIQKCSELSCEHNGQIVSPEICNSCPIRNAVLKRDETEPAEVVESKVTREKPDIGSSGYVVCDYRAKLTLVRACGRVSYVRKCKCPVAPTFNKEVTAAICENCPYRVDSGKSFVTEIFNPYREK